MKMKIPRSDIVSAGLKKQILFLLIELGRIFFIDDVNITQARPKQVLNSKVGQVAFHRKY